MSLQSKVPNKSTSGWSTALSILLLTLPFICCFAGILDIVILDALSKSNVGRLTTFNPIPAILGGTVGGLMLGTIGLLSFAQLIHTRRTVWLTVMTVGMVVGSVIIDYCEKLPEISDGQILAITAVCGGLVGASQWICLKHDSKLSSLWIICHIFIWPTVFGLCQFLAGFA